MERAKAQTKVHIVIPDTQSKPGVPNAHLKWIGTFIKDEYDGTDLTVIHLGDHWDMPSLSSYDKGKKAMEGRRYVQDINAGNNDFHELSDPFADVMADRHFFLGNHEDRITRAAEADAQVDGLITLDDLDTCGWNVHQFKVPVTLEGVTYAHYFYNPMTGRPYAGANLETRLKTIGHSFTMGHQQGYKFGRVDTVKGSHLGLVAGSCYIHDEEYMGPQTINYWRGIIVCHQVERGEYDPMFVSLDYLCRRYEGKRLSAFKWRH